MSEMVTIDINGDELNIEQLALVARLDVLRSAIQPVAMMLLAMTTLREVYGVTDPDLINLFDKLLARIRDEPEGVAFAHAFEEKP